MVGMALREFWPQSEDAEVTLPHFFPGTMSVQASSAICIPRSSGWPQADSEPKQPEQPQQR